MRNKKRTASGCLGDWMIGAHGLIYHNTNERALTKRISHVHASKLVINIVRGYKIGTLGNSKTGGRDQQKNKEMKYPE